MINSIYSNTGGYLHVTGHNNSPYIYPDPNNPATGMIRMNGNNMEVYNGGGWIQFGSSAEVSLNGAAISALDWCQKKMAEESRIKELAAKSPTVADALARYEEAQEQLKMVLTLTEAE
jgi:hypothetical protein